MENLNDFKLLTVKDVSKMLSLSKYAIYQMIYKDAIPYIRIGATNRSVRFDSQKIKEWINKNSCDNTGKS
jgi:excisionase family DNA binding protein